jgi:hypothetical protein
MARTRRLDEDGSLVIDQDGRWSSTAWFTPVHDDAHPDVIAVVCVDDTDHEVSLGRPDLLAVRAWIDEQLARNPVGEATVSDYERGVQAAGQAVLPYIDPARTVDLMRDLARLVGNYPQPNECVPAPQAQP